MPESADAFKAYIDGLNLKEEVKKKISIFDFNSPFNQKGFHPVLALHMLEYNKKLQQQ